MNAGVLSLGGSNVLSDSTAVTVAGAGLNVGVNNDTVGRFTITSGSLFGTGKLTAATYAIGGGTVTGNLGAGAMTVTGNSALNGTADVTTVNVNAGTLTLGSASRFTSSVVALTGSTGAGLTLGGNESVGSLAGGFNVAFGSATLTTGNANTNTTYSGTMTGAGGLTKSGTGTFAVTGASTYSGITTINGGVLSAATLANGGVASGIGQSTNAAANLVINGGSLQYTGGAASSNRGFTMGTSGATLDASGSGALTLSNTAAIALPTTTANRTLTLAGSNEGNNTLAALIANAGTGATSLVKSGAGHLGADWGEHLQRRHDDQRRHAHHGECGSAWHRCRHDQRRRTRPQRSLHGHQHILGDWWHAHQRHDSLHAVEWQFVRRDRRYPGRNRWSDEDDHRHGGSRW